MNATFDENIAPGPVGLAGHADKPTLSQDTKEKIALVRSINHLVEAFHRGTQRAACTPEIDGKVSDLIDRARADTSTTAVNTRLFACCRDPRPLLSLPDLDLGTVRLDEASWTEILRWAPLDHLEAMLHRDIDCMRPYPLIYEASRSRPDLIKFLFEIARVRSLTQHLAEREAPFLGHADVTFLASVLRMQVSRFERSYGTRAISLLIDGSPENALVLWLAGLDLTKPLRIGAALSNSDTAARIKDLTSSGHGQLKLRRKTGSLEEFLRDPKGIFAGIDLG